MDRHLPFPENLSLALDTDNNAYQECLDTIYQLGRFGIKLELDTIRHILDRLGSPEKTYNLVHVAGTNGKGSTATYIAAILQAAGFKTGLYTSPHLITFNERIVVNGQQISNDDVVAAYQAVHGADTGERKATFFEIVTAMGFYHFAQQKVEWAVIETGMGGRFDATNVIRPQLSVITNLSIEHTEYLGNTIKALAGEKGGIIKKGVPVVTAVSQPSGLAVIKEISKENTADLFEYKKDFSVQKDRGRSTYSYKGIHQQFKQLKKPLPGSHQKENLGVALAGCELIFKQMNQLNHLNNHDISQQLDQKLVEQGLAGTRWPGRLEHVQEKPLVIIDGAHNLKAAKVLGKYLNSRFENKKLTLVTGILDDKPYEKMLECLLPAVDKIVVTKAKIDRSLQPAVIKEAVQRVSDVPVVIIEDVNQAVDHAIEHSKENDVVCVAGSLYVAGEALSQYPF